MYVATEKSIYKRNTMKMKPLITMYLILLAGTVTAQGKMSERQQWLQYMDKVARPVMMNLAENKLKENMPIELSKKIDNVANRSGVSYLEAFGRTLSGIAPWLNLEGGSKEEVALQSIQAVGT